MKEPVKVHVIGSISKHYFDWLPFKGVLEEDLEKADLAILTGGSDINPALYGHPMSNKCGIINKKRDLFEIKNYWKAVYAGIPVIGICRGFQLSAAANGSTLVQHMSHPGNHPIITSDGNVVEVNSLHHQLVIPSGRHKLLAWAESLSPVHVWNDKIIKLKKEAEVVYFPVTKTLGIQCHPEMYSIPKSGLSYLQNLAEKLLQNKL